MDEDINYEYEFKFKSQLKLSKNEKNRYWKPNKNCNPIFREYVKKMWERNEAKQRTQ